MSRRHGGASRSLAYSALQARRRWSITNLSRRGWEQGVIAGDRRWLAVGIVAWTLWVLRWAWRKEPEVVYRTRLQPGESVLVSANRAPS